MLKSNKYIYTNSKISKLKREYTDRNFILKQLERGDDYIQTKSGQKY